MNDFLLIAAGFILLTVGSCGDRLDRFVSQPAATVAKTALISHGYKNGGR